MDTQVMNEFLRSLSKTISRKTHVVMFVDGAGWHRSDDLIVPSNITLYPLPPYSPELNPIEQIWGYLKSNFLSGRVFKDMDEIFSYGVRAWRELTRCIVRSVCTSRI
jgi:transposase